MQCYRQLNPVKAMTFDLDDTLYDNRPVIRRVEEQMVVWLHTHHPLTASESHNWWTALKIRLAQLEPALRHDVTLWRFRQIEQGLIELGYTPAQAELAAQAAIEEVLRLRSDFTVPQETHRVLGQLAQRMPLVAITNGNVDAERIGLAGYFQRVLKAGPDGRAKPYPDMFDQAREQLGLDAAEILHVGDHPVTDVAGALDNGFMACWFNDQPANLRENRKARLLPHLTISRLEQLLAL
ncbi:MULTISPECIES: 5-amino-6-(5-phospho-D-ribitylamino)uracil phosphatase YigB [unclassified Vibrio]|uniref:5-amino-6-(5-phospho-D-ribitylamino)uracil phosphatase YigB n=1 Tax=unclassified Vibrio TaxID=2614977 RepID=UPI0013613AF3|nr:MULTISPECIES: 5-amino-6-(5-phospho-D-ribitylamino)uracil phosphatase YigB [unclassified Vibrio]NAW57667.1 5-amino-6-(5-phospho-D-ribitylamino)uracil phosphatase YigB [Vibrio sp. V36_P2S2PM302]NAX22932.1 5-amino-6-(5-phospho-D-ribitylamino)uracil phosphatase YigB [Vibrio sp. V39_P1S14PM300]NAX24809.1 5-amino-6-(5-phospho-D-ribitylamino)uracil phosphatase YigB [Vibrio sp. V38_P2S17PM301]NAX31933.1 5-amino-6-(5-phospho-D-ribitylamino)uracil phosphatase YigB [Vibrio sp. V37_P2S8PM304]